MSDSISGIVSINYFIYFFYFNLASNVKTKTEEKEREKTEDKEPLKKEEKKEEEVNNNSKLNEKKEQPMIIGTPIFFNPMPNVPKFYYNKIYKRKGKIFTEREGDWICNSCKNLNFAFRVECNRCHLAKGATEKKEVIENNKENKENQQQRGCKKNNKHKKGYNHYGKNKGNGKE